MNDEHVHSWRYGDDGALAVCRFCDEVYYAGPPWSDVDEEFASGEAARGAGTIPPSAPPSETIPVSPYGPVFPFGG